MSLEFLMDSFTMAMISPSSALLPAGFFGSDMNTFSPPLMDYLSHTTGAHYHYFPYMACDGTPAYEYSKCYNLPCKLMSEMPGVLYQMGLRQLVLQAEFESLKKFHPTTVAFSETVKEAWGFPSHKAEVATSSSDDTGNGACASSTPSCTPTVETDSEVEEADVDVMQEEGVSNSTPLQEDQEDPAPLLTPASTQIHSQHVSDVVTDPPNQELARFSPPTQDFSVGNGFVRRVNIIAKPARHHGSTHLNRQKELVIVKLSGNIPDKSREVAKFVRKGQRKVPPSVDLSSLPLRTARSSSPERDSGSSTVAIDNKIEQAMDLVKSHLMYAVREEVEVLKEQIKELMERLSQLEYENNILRAAATPDTLAKLTPQTQPSQPPPSSSS